MVTLSTTLLMTSPGVKLSGLYRPNRWSNGPSYLRQPPDTWPERPRASVQQDPTELKGLTFCSLTTVGQHQAETAQHTSQKDLVEATFKDTNSIVTSNNISSGPTWRDAVFRLMRRCQADSFTEELNGL